MDSATTSASAAMTAEDVQHLTSVARHIRIVVKMVLAEMAVIGIFLVLFAGAIYSIISRPQKTRRTWILLSVLCITAILTALQCGVDMFFVLELIQKILIDNSDLPFTSRVAAYNNMPGLLPAQYIVYFVADSADTGLLFITNDALATWRALAICHTISRPFTKFLLCFLMFCTFVLLFPSVVFAMLQAKQNAFSNSDIVAILSITTSSVSIAANALATGMIDYMAYEHQIFQSPNGIRFNSARILILFTESGLFYISIQIIRLALAVSVVESTPLYGSLDTADNVFEKMTSVLSATYTPALILIINYGYSLADTIQISNVNAGSRPRDNADVPSTMSAIAFGHSEDRDTTEPQL